ncbi:MAG TPA: hypothetical protein VHZ75_00625 [Solirubrobacteraceae bacterium]|nr:hypothetical protein [Solirubrobacteraceae bacterium]
MLRKASGKASSAVAALRRAATVVLALVVVAAAAYVVKTRLLDRDSASDSTAPSLSVRVLKPGSFSADHPYAPYYVIPDKRFADPSKLTHLARNNLLTRPASALSKGALAGSPQIVRLALRTTSAAPVTIDAIHVEVRSRAKPLRGWYTALPSCMLTPVPRAKLHLGSTQTAVRYVTAAGSSSHTLALHVTKAAPKIIELQASTAHHRVAWTASLSVRDEHGHSATIAIDDGGEPFRVTSAADSQPYRPIYGAAGIIGYAREHAIKGCAS